MKGKILLCVLDWGLGHATRSLALVQVLRSEGFEVVIASSGQALTALKIELSEFRFHELPSYSISYDHGSFTLGMISRLPHIFRTIRRERSYIESIVAEEKPDAIISDCRYGCYYPGVKSIFLSHHLVIQLQGLWRVASGVVNFVHKKLIKKFDECWVPDFSDRYLSGDLSKLHLGQLRFIGPLSTMKRSANLPATKYTLLAVLSGPEPERTNFAEQLSSELELAAGPWLVVHGKPGEKEEQRNGHVSFMTREELNRAMEAAQVIIARSGYSTVMDAAALGARMIFVPTPGQTEQLYLATRCMNRGIAFYQEQHEFKLAVAIQESEKYAGFPSREDRSNDLLVVAARTLRHGQ